MQAKTGKEGIRHGENLEGVLAQPIKAVQGKALQNRQPILRTVVPTKKDSREATRTDGCTGVGLMSGGSSLSNFACWKRLQAEQDQPRPELFREFHGREADAKLESS